VKEMAMAEWLTTTASRALLRSMDRFSSMPTTNMNRIRPICARNCRLPMEAAGKRKALYCGQCSAMNEGPRKMPAAISPTTLCNPSFWNTKPKARATTMMVRICSSRMASGWVRFSW